MKTLLILTFSILLINKSISQPLQKSESTNNNQIKSFTYASITVMYKGLSKKLSVNVDLGESDEQTKLGKEYSEILTNKKSFAAVLNYMSEKKYELVETLVDNLTYQGSGTTYAITFIMKKVKE